MLKAKKRVFIIGSCVSRDVLELTDKYEIVEYVGRTSLASAFSDKPFPGPNDGLLEASIESNWQRRCVQYDTRKELSWLLHNREYDVIILDFADERFKLISCQGAVATFSPEFRMTGLQNTHHISFLKPQSWFRRQRWKRGLDELLSIAQKRGVPVFLNEVYSARYNNEGKSFGQWSTFRKNLKFRWFYKHVPESVMHFRVPKNIAISDVGHKWGKSPFHYIEDVYRCLLEQLHNAL